MKAIRTYYLKKALKAHRTQIDYTGWTNVNNILILFDADADHPGDHLSILNHFSGIAPKVHYLVYAQTKKPKADLPANTYFKRDVSYIGRPTKAVFALLPEVDVLIDWTKKETSPNDFLAVASKAGFKIGVDRNLSCFNMVVKGKDNTAADVVNEILNYLKLINNDD